MRHHLRMSKLRTYVVLVVATALMIGSTVSSVSAAAPKVGSTCKKVGTLTDLKEWPEAGMTHIVKPGVRGQKTALFGA